MEKYKVEYVIEIDADTPEKAALTVEEYMKNGTYRPVLLVISSDGTRTDVDLEKFNKVKDAYTDGICPDCAEEIPGNAVEGEECSNCGHVFYKINPDS